MTSSGLSPAVAATRRHRPRIIVLIGMTLLALAYLGVLRADDLGMGDAMVVGALAIAMAGGEFLRVGGPTHRSIAPVATGAAVALALASVSDNHELAYGAPLVVVTVALIILLTAVWLEKPDNLSFRIAGHTIRVIVMGFLAVAFRELPLMEGGSLAHAAAQGEIEPWALALTMLGLTCLAQLLELSLHVWMRTALGRQQWREILAEDARDMLPIAAAAMSTGVVVAIGLRSLGLMAIVLFLAPLVLMRISIARRTGAIQARRQSITALSRLTDLAGYTEPGHAERVAVLCGLVGREVHLPARSIIHLETAALLHDVGQIGLRHSVPYGATINLAPLDQEQIADDSADLVEEAVYLTQSAAIIRSYPTSFRVLHEEAKRLSVEARILKVCNAYDDLTRGDPLRREPALERIMLGLGYEYDPAVVDVLRTVTVNLTPPTEVPAGAEDEAAPSRP